MLSRTIARSLMALVPEKRTAVLTLLPDSPSPITVNAFNAWLKPMDVRLSSYGGVNLQGDETRIKIPDHELNPGNNGREIRPRDAIVMDGTSYTVIAARLTCIRTVWECIVRKDIA